MSNSNESVSGSVSWSGRPWIAPAAVSRTVTVILVGFLIVWLEYFSGAQNNSLFGVSILIWTGLTFLVIWLISITGLLIERATNLYTLRTDSLEIKTGVLTSRSSTIVASGFSDLEVVRGVAGRILEYGEIIIRTQSERQPEHTMKKVRNPLKVADQIRYVMGRQIVRMETPLPPEKNP